MTLLTTNYWNHGIHGIHRRGGFAAGLPGILKTTEYTEYTEGALRAGLPVWNEPRKLDDNSFDFNIRVMTEIYE